MIALIDNKSEFPLHACPAAVQCAVQHMTSHFGIPTGSAAMMALTVAMAAAGNRRTLRGTPDAPQSSSLFTVLEAPADSGAAEALQWVSAPVWGRRCVLQADHLVRGHRRARQAMRSPRMDVSRALDPDVLEDTVPILDGENVVRHPQIMLDGLARLPVWRDAVAHSYDHGLLAIANQESMLSLGAMEAADRCELIGWLRDVSKGGKVLRGLPPQVCLFWLIEPADAAITRYSLYGYRNAALPAFVVPWLEEGPVEPDVFEAPGPLKQGDWEAFIGRLLDRREAPVCTYWSIDWDASVRLMTFEEALSAESGASPEVIERAMETTRRLGVLFAALNAPDATMGIVERPHVAQGCAIAAWLVRQHRAWETGIDAQPMTDDARSPEEELINGLEVYFSLTPDLLHSVLSGREGLTPAAAREILEGIAAGAGPEEW